jgi:hypothetical protein
MVAGFFIMNPLCGSHLPPVRNGPQNHPLSHGHGKILDQVTGKIITFVTPCVSVALGAIPDAAFPAISERLLGETPAAVDIFGPQGFGAGNSSFVHPNQTLPEFLVVVPGGVKDGANPAIQTTRREIIRIHVHKSPQDGALRADPRFSA